MRISAMIAGALHRSEYRSIIDWYSLRHQCSQRPRVEVPFLGDSEPGHRRRRISLWPRRTNNANLDMRNPIPPER